MIVTPLSPLVTLEREDGLYAIEEVRSDERLVLARVVDTLPAHGPDVERIGERDCESCTRELTAPGVEASFREMGLECGQRPRARCVELERFADERSVLRVDLDPGFASFALGSDVAVSDGCLGGPPTALTAEAQITLRCPRSPALRKLDVQGLHHREL